MNTMKLVNIVIPVHNRLEHTVQTLESLINNTPKSLYNLYIINDQSSNVVQDFLVDFNKQDKGVETKLYHNAENVGPAVSRNLVCKNITDNGERGVFLYHSDNDVYFKENWLDVLIDTYDRFKDKVKLLGGGCHPYLRNNAVMGNVGIKDAVSGYSQLMTWDTWDKYGPFDEGSRGQVEKIMGSEDWAFCQRIVKDGYLVGSVEPEVVIATGMTNTYGHPATGHETFKQFNGIKVL